MSFSSAWRSASVLPSRDASHARRASRSASVKSSASQMTERLAYFAEVYGGARPVEPRPPDVRIVGAAHAATFEQRGGLVEPAGLHGQAGLRQPDPVVQSGATRMARSTSHRTFSRRTGELSILQWSRSSHDRVGCRVPARFEQPAERLSRRPSQK